MKKGFIAGVLTALLVLAMVGSAGATNGKVQKEIEYRDIKVSLGCILMFLAIILAQLPDKK